MNRNRAISKGFSFSANEFNEKKFTVESIEGNNKIIDDIMNIDMNYQINNAKEVYLKTKDENKAIQKLSSNIGNIGIAIDFRDAQLVNPVETTSPLFTWLDSGSASARIRQWDGLSHPYKDCDGKWTMLMPPIIGTTPGEDTSGACCWAPFDIMMCNDKFNLNLLCMEDCADIFDYLVSQRRSPAGGDLTSYFQRSGETVQDARRRMALLSMQWLTINNVILGSESIDTGNLKPFHGLFDVMNDEFVLNFTGSNILSAFEQITCRMMWLNRNGNRDWGIAVNPITYLAIAKAIRKDRFGEYPPGWNVTYNGANPTVTYSGITFIDDERVPVDRESNTGEAWVIDRSVVGIYLATSLAPGEDFHFNYFTSANENSENCGTVCDRWYNYGGAFSLDKYGSMIISGIPLNGTCSGDALLGLDNIINPTSPAPLLY